MEPERSKIQAVLAEMSRDEVCRAPWYVTFFECAGCMSRDEADRWREEIRARRAWLDLSREPRAPH